MSGRGRSGLRAELYVRTLRPRSGHAHQQSILERLEELAAGGVLAEFDVFVTGRAVPPAPSAAETEFGAFLVNRAAVFEEWADRSGRPLAAPIERRSVNSAFTGEDYDALVLPGMVLADYEGDALRFVAPSGAGESHVSIEARLDDLAADDSTGDAASLDRARVASAEEFSGSPG